jgi:aminoacyl tRNA synthase complex-interacting multifunctional protein 1
MTSSTSIGLLVRRLSFSTNLPVCLTATMTAGSVPSAAALCALHVDSPAASKDFQKDVVLQLVLQLAPTLQCKVIRGHPPHDATAPAGSKPAGAGAAPAIGGPLRLQVGPHEHENLLRQRNSIVRALCGMGLHGLMDHQFKLLGGHAVKAFRASSGNDNNSATSSLALASIVEWMAVAQNLSEPHLSDEEVHGVLKRCESHLATHAHLVPFVPNATVADYDVAVAILTRSSLLEKAVKGRNTVRWLRRCHAELVRRGIQDICSAAKVTLLAPPAAAPKLPIFYSGTEAAASITAAPAPPAASAKMSNVTAAAHAAPGKKESTTSAPPPKQAPAPATKAADPSPPNANADSKKSDKKAAKAAAAAAAAASAPAPAPAEYNVGSLDIRVGQIVEVSEHETADKLFCEVIDLGSEQRKIASGLRPFYSLKDLENRRVLVLCNLKARNLVGFPSHGMVLCASNDDHTAVEFVVPPPDAPLGSRVVFDGYESVVPEPEAKVAKKKIFEQVSPDLRTNANGQVAWKGALGRVEGTDKSSDSASVVKALNGMPNARVS